MNSDFKILFLVNIYFYSNKLTKYYLMELSSTVLVAPWVLVASFGCLVVALATMATDLGMVCQILLAGLPVVEKYIKLSSLYTF